MIAKILSNKKSDISARKIIFYAVFGFVAIVVFFLIVWLTGSKSLEISKIPPGIENYLTSQRFLNSPSCFAFQDENTKRTYLWSIDLRKFNQETLNKCYNAEDTKVNAYRLTMTYENQKITLNTKNWEGFLKKAETKHVSIYDEGKTKRGELFIETQDAK